MGTANVDIQHLHVAVNCPFMEALDAKLDRRIHLFVHRSNREEKNKATARSVGSV